MDYILKKPENVEIPDSDLKKGDKFYILVSLFIKKDLSKSWDTNDWIRERTACKRLTNKYKEFDFFYSLVNLQGKFNSLLGLLSKKIQNLDRLYDDFIIEKNRRPCYSLEDSPVIEFIENKKSKDLIDLLDN